MDRVVQLVGEAHLDARPCDHWEICQILYPIILVSFGFVFVQAIRK